MIPSCSRRSFLKQGAVAATVTSFGATLTTPRPLLALLGPVPEPVPPIDDPRLKSLVQQALDAARSAGATYADVRLTYTRERQLRRAGRYLRDTESMTAGVRALRDGYWGFASSPVWSTDEMTRLGQEAVRQSAANSLGKPRVTELAATPVVSDGHWTMPVRIDPFSVHPSEMFDILNGLYVYTERRSGIAGATYAFEFRCQDKAFGSSDDSYFTQRTYLSGGEYEVSYKESDERSGSGGIDFLSPAGVGFEMVDEAVMRTAIDRIVEEIKADFDIPVRPVDVGRFDAVLSAQALIPLLSGAVGAATELDRALGYEANAGGTSYLSDPLEMLGKFVVGTSALTITANRTEPHAAATVQWDDEGVVPHTVPLITKGVLTDYQTTREGARWLADYYAKHDRPIRSQGCAYGMTAVDVPLPQTANLAMTPGAERLDEAALLGQMNKGVYFKQLKVNLDFQQLNGLAFGDCYGIVNGRKTARLLNVGALFRTPELLKSIRALGDASTLRAYGVATRKGQPAQTAYHTVAAVPALFEKLTLIDVMRKA